LAGFNPRILSNWTLIQKSEPALFSACAFVSLGKKKENETAVKIKHSAPKAFVRTPDHPLVVVTFAAAVAAHCARSECLTSNSKRRCFFSLSLSLSLSIGTLIIIKQKEEGDGVDDDKEKREGKRIDGTQNPLASPARISAPYSFANGI